MPVTESSQFTTLSGGARRTWAHPEVRSHSLVVLTVDRIYAAPLAGAPRPEIIAAVAAGGDLDDLLGSLAVVIDLSSVRRLKHNLLTNALVIDYAKGRAGTGQLTLAFAHPEAADACYTKLWRRLGKDFRLRPYKRDAWAAARGPLALLIGALFATAVLALVLSIFEDMASARARGPRRGPRRGGSGRPRRPPRPGPTPLEVLVGWMNWRVVCAVGGAVAAVAQVWLFRRLTSPPESLVLVRS
ncbi:hypothetical protein [Frigoriglobus tundricola]|uniref:Uncharacterized protein n=1 Tax=Frigoriglobus tundricola TaxID=2774151 RepID=A0A6M5YLG5_9BACT|nr:hypothetical protein [Frigoriglobus tundricola]QJW94146.1 hypothetical protein FTUN_1665 [Frigoriglobus tundricola]